MTSDGRERIGQLYARVGARLAAIAAGKYGLPHDVAADATQDVFVDLLQNEDFASRLAAFDDAATFRYLLTAIIHRASRELKRRARIDARPLEIIESLLTDRGLTSPPQPFELADAIRGALGDMRSPYQEVLIGLIIKRQSAQDLAAELNRPVNTIYQQTHRGLQMLKERIQAAPKR